MRKICNLSPITYHIVLFQIEPYMMMRPELRNTTGNQKYYGYMADVLQELSNYLGFQYEIAEVPDGSYGYKQSDSSWNGMVGQLMRKVGSFFFLLITLNRQ